jgi:hypothetical protein
MLCFHFQLHAVTRRTRPSAGAGSDSAALRLRPGAQPPPGGPYPGRRRPKAAGESGPSGGRGCHRDGHAGPRFKFSANLPVNCHGNIMIAGRATRKLHRSKMLQCLRGSGSESEGRSASEAPRRPRRLEVTAWPGIRAARAGARHWMRR